MTDHTGCAHGQIRAGMGFMIQIRPLGGLMGILGFFKSKVDQRRESTIARKHRGGQSCLVVNLTKPMDWMVVLSGIGESCFGQKENDVND